MDDTKPPSGASQPAWRTCLDLESQQAGHYLDFWNEGLMRLVDRAPSRALELGCATGAFGAQLKQRYPGAYVAGIEANPGAASRASERLDHVTCARVEAVDFEREPPGGGHYDLVIAADILEHLINPWELLVRLRACLAPGGAVLASIPNIRSFLILSQLMHEGRWEYQERGLLDVTHLRFFAFEDIRAMFDETGYVVETVAINVSPPLSRLYHAHRDQPASTIRMGRLTFHDVTPRELTELCAEQFLLRCRPGPLASPAPATGAAP